MLHSRHAIALLGSLALASGTAAAAPVLGSVHAGASGSMHIAGPPIGVPNVGVPPAGAPPVNVPHPLNAPPVNVPQPRASAAVNASANARAQSNTRAPERATVTSVTGGTVAVRLQNGTTQSYSVNAKQAQFLKTHVGKSVTFWTTSNGTFELNQSSNSAKPHHSRRK